MGLAGVVKGLGWCARQKKPGTRPGTTLAGLLQGGKSRGLFALDYCNTIAAMVRLQVGGVQALQLQQQA